MKSYRFFMLLLVLCIVVCCGCDSEKPSDSTAEEKEVSKSLLHPAGTTLKTRIQTPDGYTRTKVRKNTLTAFLRNDSLKKDGSPVFLYNGSKKGNQSDHIAVFKKVIAFKYLTLIRIGPKAPLMTIPMNAFKNIYDLYLPMQALLPWNQNQPRLI